MAPRQVTYCHPSPPLSLSHSPLKGDSFKFQLIDKSTNVFIIRENFHAYRLIFGFRIFGEFGKRAISLPLRLWCWMKQRLNRKVAKGRRAMWHFTLRELRERVSKGHVFPLSSPSVALRPFYDPVSRTLSRIDKRNDAVDARQKGGLHNRPTPRSSTRFSLSGK